MNSDSDFDDFHFATHYSDEPTRVKQIVTRFFKDQSGTPLARVESSDVVLSIGADHRDDCAVLDVHGPMSLVFGSDYVRGPKFALYERGLLSNYDLGYYLVIANVSDIAAMGATPVALTTVIRYPKTMSDAEFQAIVHGVSDAATACGALNVGGDIGGAERVILSAAALGVCRLGGALTRAGARPGDALCVTGPVGTAGAAVVYFGGPDSGLDGFHEAVLLNAWKRPQARTVEGRILGDLGLATACQDVSDGLKATVEQLGTSSGVGFIVDRQLLPIEDATLAVAEELGLDAVALALSASVDFQLAFTVDGRMVDTCRAEFEKAGRHLHVIGEATETVQFSLRLSNGTLEPLPGVTWRHQDGDVSKLATAEP